jgi:hypothetical protein
MKNDKYEKCDWATQRTEYKTCGVDVSKWWECNSNRNFGLNKDLFRPCIFLQFNANSEWKPEYYDVNELPSSMPDDLKKVIKYTTTGM